MNEIAGRRSIRDFKYKAGLHSVFLHGKNAFLNEKMPTHAAFPLRNQQAFR